MSDTEKTKEPNQSKDKAQHISSGDLVRGLIVDKWLALPQKAKLTCAAVAVLLVVFLVSRQTKIDGVYQCGATSYTFNLDGSITSSDGIRPMKYKVEDSYIYILSPANEWIPILKKSGDDIFLNMEGTGFADARCEKR